MAIDFTIDNLLADCCSNPDSDPSEGWNVYIIELHCSNYKLSARVVQEGEMNQESGTWIVTPKYEIRSVEKVL